MNKLNKSKSAYLLQHKDNPVHWHPYSAEIIHEAQKQNKPIFLSIGYSACHWCHVMAHESFEDQTTADFLNQNFINIKIDREEHPDVDQYYQIACQIFTGRGGWPLSVFLTPQMKPYFIGTYFPKTGRQGLPSFMEVSQKLHHAYKNDYENVIKNADLITNAIQNDSKPEMKQIYQGKFPSAGQILKALEQYQDNEYGSYGGAPKFPHFAFFEWAIEQCLEAKVPKEQVDHIINSVENILMGGIFDQARGGIHRYSVDEKWLIPHFEKMLYDQSGLIKVLAKISLIKNTPLISDSLVKTLEYLKAEMVSDKKFFFAAQDADSEGEEGLYFSFKKDEFLECLNDNQEQFLNWYQIEEEGNFEHGLNVISLNKEYKLDYEKAENWEKIKKINQELLKKRRERIPPQTDTKGISSWNFMLITALVDVVQYAQNSLAKNLALELIKTSLESIHKEFIRPLESNNNLNMIAQSNTVDDSIPLFENYVFYAEMQLRLYELTAVEIYKKNGFETLDYIYNEFSKNNKFFTRAISHESSQPFQNIEVSFFDQSYKSSLATYVQLLRKWYPELKNKKPVDDLAPLFDELRNHCLQNPFGCGEGLRAFTYPNEAYKKLEIPKRWLEDPNFTKFLPYFSVRFALSYHDKSQDEWQYCGYTACELNGKSLEDFIKAFSQP